MATNQIDPALDELNGNVYTRSSEVFLVRHANKIAVKVLNTKQITFKLEVAICDLKLVTVVASSELPLL